MDSRAGPGSDGFFFLWSDLVDALVLAYDTVILYTQKLLLFFTTPFSQIIDSDTGITSWITDVIQFVLDLFGVNFLELTPLEFMLGSTIPIILVFTIYRYVKQ